MIKRTIGAVTTSLRALVTEFRNRDMGLLGLATVRGTTWLVVDLCGASTLFKVGEGTVWVQDFVKHKSRVLTTGQQYIAKAPIPRLNPNIWH